MPTNRFTHTMQPGVNNSQRLLDRLNREAIRFAGIETYYIPRDSVSIDQLFNEEIQSGFSEGYPIEMHLGSIDGFDGQELLQKFGVEVRDEVTLTVNKQRFLEVLHSTPHSDIKRAREGDLIFIPLSKSIYEINFVEHEQPFYQLGTVPNYELRAHLFEYTGEQFDTNIEGLDVPNADQDNTIEFEGFTFKLELDTNVAWELGETVTQTLSGHNVIGEIVKIESDKSAIYINGVSNTTSDDSYGIFVASETITGNTSGVSSTVTSVEQVMDDYADNEYINDTGTPKILWSSET